MEGEHEAREEVEFAGPVALSIIQSGYSGIEDSCIPQKLRRNTLFRAKIPRRIECISRMHAGTHVTAIGHTAGIPGRPSRKGCRTGDVGGVGL